jgi:hypothetical protein
MEFFFNPSGRTRPCGLLSFYILPALDLRYATSRKAAGSSPDEVIDIFFFIYLILPAALGPGVYASSNRNEYQKIFLGVKCGRGVWMTT